MTRYRLTRQQMRLVSARSGRDNGIGQIAVETGGRLTVRALEDALQQVVGRHEALRTLLIEDEESKHPLQTVQQILPAATCHVLVDDPPTGPALAERLDELGAVERERAFDRERGPLVRMATLASGDDVLGFVVTASSTAADARSLVNVVRELDQILAGGSAGNDPPTQYLQYAQWQAGLLETGEARDGKAFWERVLEKAPASASVSLSRVEVRSKGIVHSGRDLRSGPAGAGESLACSDQRRIYGDTMTTCLRSLAGRRTRRLALHWSPICDR